MTGYRANPISIQVARSLWDYNPETGEITWRVTRNAHGGRVAPGVVAGTRKDGYVQLCTSGRQYRAHRVAWLLMTGDHPPFDMDIDHVNGNRSDNRWSNLRLATRSQNNTNRRTAKTSSGVNGVYQRGDTGKWHARVTVNYRVIHLGQFDTKDEAISARRAGEAQHYGNYRGE
jgi:hypothetical protein